MDDRNGCEDKKRTHPFAEANFFSRLFFLYTLSSLKTSFDPKELYNPIKSYKSELLGDRLERSWNRHIVTTGKKRKKFVIFKSILSAFWPELLKTALVSCIEVLLRIAEPVCLGFVLSYFQPSTSMTEKEVLFWTIGMLAANGSRVIAYAQQRSLTLHVALKIRVACSNLIYRKVLRLRSTTLQKDGGGKIITLMSNDLSRFDMRTELINYVYTAPLVVVAVIYIMYQEFGTSGLVGVAFIFFITVIQAFFAHYVSSFHLITAILTDDRMRLMHSLLTGIQVIKMYAWENSFSKLIDKARIKELNIIGKSFLVKAIYESVYTFIVPISIFLALYVVIDEHEQITVVMIFLMVIYYTLLNYMISIFFTLGVAKLFEIYVVLKRVNDFLLFEERQLEEGKVWKEPEEVPVFVSLDNVSATWAECIEKKDIHESSEEIILSEKTALLRESRRSSGISDNDSKQLKIYGVPSNRGAGLRDINLKVEGNEFLGIIGPIGSGKSSLLHVILGELLISSGSKKISGRISYAPQIAWTFASSIRQNIIFGLEYNEERYDEVVRVCGLEKDFQQFPEGDLTLVGDRGASLSGGQKARINLARAVYRQADIYLFDDPLAAVDMGVANHLFYECMMNFLGDKCRILVTHHVSHLRAADNIICMNNGIIEHQGSYKDLIECGMIFDDLETMEIKKSYIDAYGENYSVFKNESVSLEVSSSSSESSSQTAEPQDDNISIQQKLASRTHDMVHKSRERGILLFKYILSGGKTWSLAFTILIFIANQIIISGISYYLGLWSSVEEMRNKFSFLSPKVLRNAFGLQRKMYFEDWFGCLVLVLIFAALLKSYLYARLVKANSQKIHNTLLEKVTNTNLRFYNTNSSGRILNRFSRDLGIIDEVLPRAIMEATQIILMSIGSFLLLLIVDLDFIFPTIIVNVLFIALLAVFSKITKEIKRVESKLLGPILTHVSTSAQGITTIKALSAEKVLTEEFENHQDNYTSSWFLYGSSSIALSFYVDFSCFLFLLYIALILVLYAKSWNISGGFVGMALTQAMSLTGVIQYGIRQTLEANSQLIAVERISRYDNLEKEEDPKIMVEPPPQWPDDGKIVFDGVGLRYDPEQPLVLRNINFVINPNDKIGIVGRTGAGKSSIMAALFRLSIVEGIIEIDGFDTSDISLKLLRSKIAVIPQDPILFAGTLRFNLDPFDKHNDSTLYRAVQAVELKNPSGQLFSLDYQVMERGSNCSVGQRQLICLARALIRNNKILILDEATSNVDPGTDALIQKTIRREFGDCTVLTIAHRLNTVMDSDKVMVMDSGELIEYDHPHILLQNTNSKFYQMVVEAGPSEAERLRKAAFDSYIGWKKH